jgi:branched-subunit amino acid aminotransferase/4-amino-4-deoxychorismate lyase
MRGLRLATERGFDEVLLVTPQDVVLEAATASVFWIERGRVLTPPLTVGILDSITRRHVLRLAAGHEEEGSLARLAAASEVFVVSTRIDVAPVIEIEGVGKYGVGEITQSLSVAFGRDIQNQVTTLDDG